MQKNMSNGRYCCSHLWKIKFAIAWILKSIRIIIGLVLEGERVSQVLKC